MDGYEMMYNINSWLNLTGLGGYAVNTFNIYWKDRPVLYRRFYSSQDDVGEALTFILVYYVLLSKHLKLS